MPRYTPMTYSHCSRVLGKGFHRMLHHSPALIHGMEWLLH